MNKRIYKKVYNRADKKLISYIKANKDERSTLEVAKTENILSLLETKVFLKEQNKRLKLFNEIKKELISEGEWQ